MLQLKVELSERFEHFKMDKAGKQEVAGALKEDKPKCFSAENFNSQDHYCINKNKRLGIILQIYEEKIKKGRADELLWHRY